MKVEFLGGGAQHPSEAVVTLIPVTLEFSTRWKKGTERGPQALLEASFELEDFSPETGEDASLFIFTSQPIKDKNLEEVQKKLSSAIHSALSSRTLPLVIGGEHTVTYFGALALREKNFKPGGILIFDAHADALPSYQGKNISHASVVRLIRNIWKDVPVFLAGVRVFSPEEWEFIEKDPLIQIWSPRGPWKIWEGIHRCTSFLKPPLFISLDLDVIDPSFLSEVSNPVPGGLSPEELFSWLRRILLQLETLYLDIVEFCPLSGDRPSLLPATCVKLIAELAFLKNLRNQI